VDFSKPASAAFEYALAMSARHGAELTAVHAIPQNESYRWQAHARTALLNRLRHEAEQAHVRLHTRVQSGDAAAIILLHARSLRPHVIVIGTHQRRGIHRLRLTSVAERVAANADVPLLLVPAVLSGNPVRAAAESPTIAVSGDHTEAGESGALFRNILVPIDFSDVSVRALAAALPLAQQSRGRLRLLHVLEGFPDESVYSGSRALRLTHDLRTHVVRANRRLQALIPPGALNWSDLAVATVSGRPHEAIVADASEQGADLVVLGLPRRSRLEELVVGSTVHRVLRRAAAPALLVPEPSASMVRPANEGDVPSAQHSDLARHTAGDWPMEVTAS
jgi:nucleotide-binding universal stress UspA family protein